MAHEDVDDSPTEFYWDHGNGVTPRTSRMNDIAALLSTEVDPVDPATRAFFEDEVSALQAAKDAEDAEVATPAKVTFPEWRQCPAELHCQQDAVANGL
eukprot:gene23698-26497_t